MVNSKMSKRVVSAIIASVLSMVMINSTVNAQQTTNEAVHFMNNVNPEMVNSTYWLGDGGKDVLMSGDQILRFNAACKAVPETNMNDLINLPDTYDGQAVKASLANFENPSKLYLNRKPVPDSYYDAIRSNIEGAKTRADMKVGYGIIINRTVMKTLPYKDFLSDSPDDPEWDNLVNSSALINEPVLCYIKTADGKFTYIKSECCEGWIPTEDVVLCHDKSEWLTATNKENVVVVTGDKIYLEASSANPTISGKALDMGTILPISQALGMVDNRMQWYNYVVLLPSVGKDGLYAANPVIIPMSRDVHAGFLPLTQENIIKQAMKCLGDRYGWGGMLDSRDCSSYVREVYLCFGIALPRNTTWQAKMPSRVDDISGLSEEERKQYLDKLPVGSILQIPGHEMIYLGKSGDDYFTINDVSSIIINNDEGNGVRYRGRGVVINGLIDAKRGNGNSWMQELTNVIVPWQ